MMNEKFVSYNLEISEPDLAVLTMALSSAVSTKRDIIRFYEDNADQPVCTPMSMLQHEVDALNRLLHIFQTCGMHESDDPSAFQGDVISKDDGLPF